MKVEVALLAGLLESSPGIAAPLAATQPRPNEVRAGRQVVDYQPPVTAEQAREIAELLERARPDPEEAPVRIRRSKDGYSLWIAFPGETWNDPASQQRAAWAAGLVSGAVLDGAPLTVHLSDGKLESKRALSLELEPEGVHFYRGEALALQKRNVEAIEEFRKAAELRPKNTTFLLRYGEALVHEWRDAEAERAYRAALELDPDNGLLAHFLLAELTFDRGQLKAALPYYLRAVELQPDFARAHEMLASTYDLLVRYDEAIAHYDRAIQLAPSATLYNELGISYRNKKELDEAIARFRAGIELFPEDALLHRNLASTLVMAGRGDQSGPVWTRGAPALPSRRGEGARTPRPSRESGLHDGPSPGLRGSHRFVPKSARTRAARTTYLGRARRRLHQHEAIRRGDRRVPEDGGPAAGRRLRSSPSGNCARNCRTLR